VSTASSSQGGPPRTLASVSPEKQDSCQTQTPSREADHTRAVQTPAGQG
jgi:hypothetical protein